MSSNPAQLEETIQLAHGGGGRLMHRLINDVFGAAFNHPDFDAENDAVVLPWSSSSLVLTTDSFVVTPLFFPGGDIGSLAVNGTVNDLAMRAARPMWLAVSFIVEEGFSTASLRKIALSMRAAANAAGVTIVTGDTKVVDRGHGHSVYINTTGVGCLDHNIKTGPKRIQAGDAIILNGDIGRHGIAVLTAREELAFESAIESDSAPLAADVLGLVEEGINLHCLRDLTRGGLAGALVELCESSSRTFVIQEERIPVDSAVTAACEVLGLSPWHIANEGRFVAFLPQDQAERAIQELRNRHPGRQPAVIGEVASETDSLVVARTLLGGERVIDMPRGDLLPRIC